MSLITLETWQVEVRIEQDTHTVSISNRERVRGVVSDLSPFDAVHAKSQPIIIIIA